MKYPMIERLGLKIHELKSGWTAGLLGQKKEEYINSIVGVVAAGDLENLLFLAKTVYSDRLETWGAFGYKDTHSALLVGIQELKPKEVTITKEKLVNAYAKVYSCKKKEHPFYQLLTSQEDKTKDLFNDFAEELGL